MLNISLLCRLQKNDKWVRFPGNGGKRADRAARVQGFGASQKRRDNGSSGVATQFVPHWHLAGDVVSFAFR
jgi:hypothetical protein